MDDCPAQSDVESAIDFTWEVLFLSPWELVYIGIPYVCFGVLYPNDLCHIQSDTKEVFVKDL